MIEVEKLKEMAETYKQQNYRWMDFSIDTIWYGVKAQTCHTLTAQELRVFLSAMTGYPFELSTCEKALANAPDWMKS